MAECNNAEPSDEQSINQLTRTNDELLNKIDNLKDQNQKQLLNIKQLMQEKDKLYQQIDEQSDQCSVEQSKIQKLEIKNQVYMEELELLQNDIKTLQNESQNAFTTKDETIAHLEKSSHDLNQKYEALSNENAEKSEIIENMKRHNNDLKKQCQETHANHLDLMKNIQEMNANKETAKKHETELIEIIHDLKVENDRLKEQNETNHIELENKTKEILDITAHNDATKEEISQLRQSKEALSATLQDETHKYMQEIEAFKVEIQQYNDVICTHKTNKTETDERIQQLNGELKDVCMRNEKLKKDITVGGKESEEKAEIIGACMEEITLLKALNGDCGKQIQDGKRIIDELNDEIHNKYKQELSEYKILNDEISAELNVSRSKMVSLESTVDRFTNDKISNNEYYEQQIKEKELKLEELTQNVMEMSRNIQDKHQELMESNQKLEILQKVYKTLQEEHQVNVTALQNEQNEHGISRKCMEDYTDRYHQKVQDINAFEIKMNDNVAVIEDKNEQIFKFESEIGAMKKHKEQSVEAIAGLRQKLEHITNEYDRVMTECNDIQRLNGEQKEMITKYEGLEEKVTNIKCKLKQKEDEYTECIKVRNEMISNITELNQLNEKQLTEMNDTRTKLMNATKVIGTLQQSNQEYKDNLDKLQFEHHEAVSMNASRTSALEDIRTQLNIKRDELKEINARYNEVRTQNDALQTENKGVQNKIKECTHDIMIKDKEIESKENSIHSFEDNVNRLNQLQQLQKEEIHKLNEQYLSSKTRNVQLENDLENVHHGKKESEDILISLQETHSEMSKDMTNKQSVIEGLEQKMKDMEDTYKEEIEELNAETKDIKSQLNVFEELKHRHMSDIEILQNESIDLKAQIFEWKTKEECNEKKWNELTNERGSLQDRLSVYQSKIEQYDVMMNELKRANTDKENKIEALKNEMNANYSNEMDKHYNTMDALNNELNHKKEEIMNLNHEFTLLKEHKWKNIQQDNERLKEELSSVQCVNHELSETVKNLTQNFASKASEVENKTKEMILQLNKFKKYENGTKKKIEKLKSGLCIKQEEIKILESNTKRKHEELDGMQIRLDEMHSEHGKIQKEYETLEKAMGESEVMKDELNAKIKCFDQKQKDQQTQIIELTQTLDDTKTLNETLKHEIQQLTAKIGIEYVQKIENLNEKIKDLNEEIKDLNEKIKNLQEIKSLMLQNVNDLTETKFKALNDKMSEYKDMETKLTALNVNISKVQTKYKEYDELKIKPICAERDAMLIELTSVQKQNQRVNKSIGTFKKKVERFQSQNKKLKQEIKELKQSNKYNENKNDENGTESLRRSSRKMRALQPINDNINSNNAHKQSEDEDSDISKGSTHKYILRSSSKKRKRNRESMEKNEAQKASILRNKCRNDQNENAIVLSAEPTRKRRKTKS